MPPRPANQQLEPEEPQPSTSSGVGGSAVAVTDGSSSNVITVDPETLAQAAMLKQMKDKFGAMQGGAGVQEMMMKMMEFMAATVSTSKTPSQQPQRKEVKKEKVFVPESPLVRGGRGAAIEGTPPSNAPEPPSIRRVKREKDENDSSDESE